MGWLLVFVGGGLGAVLRFAATRAGMALAGPTFPYATLVVNVVGSFAMGLLVAALAARSDAQADQLRLLLATGVLGGFTTFSTFSLDALSLWQRGASLAALAYVVLSLLLALAGVAAGLMLGRAL